LGQRGDFSSGNVGLLAEKLQLPREGGPGSAGVRHNQFGQARSADSWRAQRCHSLATASQLIDITPKAQRAGLHGLFRPPNRRLTEMIWLFQPMLNPVRSAEQIEHMGLPPRSRA
jgi:hypothetical protein